MRWKKFAKICSEANFAGAELSAERIAEREDLCEPKSLVMTFFKNCVRDSDLARAWRSVVGDIENMSFNTAISQLMIFNNEMMKMDKRYREPCETFVKLLYPFAPYIAEEMWSILGVFCTKAVENTVEVVFQVNGKVRAKASVAKDMDKAALEKLAMDNERVKEFTKGMTVVKSIVVPGKLVNIVVKPA